MTNTTNTAADSVATTSDDALMAREVYESQDDSLLLCASDLQHSAIYDNHIEMQSCIRAVADRITALASVIEGVERAAIAAPAQPLAAPDGWVLVPIYPTMEMRESGNKALDLIKSDVTRSLADKAYYAYEAMLKAAPQPPAPAEPTQPVCKPPKLWNKRGQDAYRRGWEEREAAMRPAP